MTQTSFGPGVMWGERTDTTGSGIGPRQFGLMQDVDLTFTFSSKELYGQEQFPAVVARGQGKITGKAKFPRINVLVYSDLFFGLTSAAGSLGVSQYEPATIPQTPAFQVTVANAAAYNDDLGVFYALTGNAFNRVTTPANAGEYSVNLSTGVYTFASPDAGLAVKVSYSYNQATSGRQVQVTNQVQGTTPYWKCTIYQKVSPGSPGAGSLSLPWVWHLNACSSSSLSFPTAQDAFTMTAIDFMAFADPSGIIGVYNAVSQ
jgi:hypothetical protein